MSDDPADSPKEVKLKADGTLDGRGHAEGSMSHRFARGDGRRRPGRTKGSISLKTAYLEAARQPVKIVDSKTGKRGSISTVEAIARRQRDKAIKGDEKATKRFEERMEQYAPEPVDPLSTALLVAEDLEILRRAIARGAFNLPSADLDGEGS